MPPGSSSSAPSPVNGTDESSVTQTAMYGPVTGLIVGLVIGGCMWFLLFQFEPQHPERQPFSTPAEVIAKTEGYVVPPKEIQLEIEFWERRVAMLNDVFFLGLFGLLLSMGMGVALGIHRRSLKTAMIAAITGGLIGCVFGLCAGLAGHYSFILLPEKTEMDPLVITIVAQGIMLSILGLGVGLAFGIITGRRHGVLNFMSFGLFAGILSAMVFAISASILTPQTDTYASIPDPIGLGRLLWCLVIGVVIAAMVTAARPRQSRGNQDADSSSTPETSMSS
jgi:hypothetical protein